jgi:hypothetical protein
MSYILRPERAPQAPPCRHGASLSAFVAVEYDSLSHRKTGKRFHLLRKDFGNFVKIPSPSGFPSHC